MICEKCGKKILDNEFASLTKHQISEILEKAVLDKRISDVKLFTYEGTGYMDDTTKDIVKEYFYGFAFKKGECEVRSTKRLLRVRKNEEENSEE